MSTGQEEHLDSKLENQISEEENQSQNQNQKRLLCQQRKNKRDKEGNV